MVRAMTEIPLAMTLKDIAREAGVSLATVDRVLHDRPGVRTETQDRVKAAIARYQFRPDAAASELARGRPLRFVMVLPTGTNAFMQQISAQAIELKHWLTRRRANLDIITTDVFNPAMLAETLERLAGRYEGAAVVALDHPRVRAAIDDLTLSGMHVVTLVSDVPTSRRRRYIGIDNIAAGRTAGTLVGRLVGQRRGRIGIVAGSLSLRDHAERIFGFSQVLSSEFPHFEVLPPIEACDDDSLSAELTERLLQENPDLVGLYNVGAGTAGVADAVVKADRGQHLVFIGHELTSASRRSLLHGVMDAVIAQDAGHEARSAIRILMALGRDDAIIEEQERIRIDIIMRDNLP